MSRFGQTAILQAAISVWSSAGAVTLKTTPYFELKNQIADAINTADSLQLEFIKYILMMAELETRHVLERLGSQLDETVQELPSSEHRFIPPLPHDPAENAVGGWRWDAKHDRLSIDPAVALLVHVPIDIHDATASLAKLMSIVHAQDRQRLNGAVRRTVMEGEVLCVAFRIVEPSGKFRWILAIGRAAFDEKVDVLSVSGTIINLTEDGRTG